MKFEIVELDEFSGKKAGVYSVLIKDEEKTLLDKFVEENESEFETELGSVIDRLEIIGHITGAREHFFKHNEGTIGDGVSALYDSPDRKLRLYCIRYGSTCIILGGGGIKNVRALQDDEKLRTENYLLRSISKKITELLKEGSPWWSNDGKRLDGDMLIED